MIKRLQNFRNRLATAAMVCVAVGSFGTSAYAETMNVSYDVKTSDPVYPYTGFSVNEDVEAMNIAIKYTSDMLAQYKGCKITKVHIGWSGVFQSFTPTAEVFVRKSLNGDNVTATDVALESPDGWNTAEFGTPYVIQENEEIFVGYTVEMKNGVYGPCTMVWGSFPESTHFISRNDYTDPDGNPEWIDLSEPGMMEMACPIMMVLEVEVESGGFENLAVISNMAMPTIMLADTETTGIIEVKNTGSNDIESLTVSYRQDGNEIYSNSLDISKPISKGNSGMVYVPAFASKTGDLELCLSEINHKPNGETDSRSLSTVVIPKDIADKYTRRPLVEYFGSESEYRSYYYDTEIISPALEKYSDRISRIDWHFDDQFQLGLADDKDEALDMLIEVVKNDSSLVYVPNILLDRSNNLGIDPSYCLAYMSSPLIGILYTPFAEASYDYALKQPTFAGLSVSASLEEDMVTVEVSGEADLSVLPEGEELMLTVVLVEDSIETDSQEMPGGSGEGEPNPGHAVHNNLVRQRLTDIWGSPIKFNDGRFNETLVTYLDYDNVAENMRVVAFINRNKENGMWDRNVLNSAEAKLTPSGIENALTDNTDLRPEIVNGSIVAKEGTVITVYSTSGAIVDPDSLPAGIYIVRATGQNGTTASFKLHVK